MVINGVVLNETQDEVKCNGITIRKLKLRLEALKAVSSYKELREVNDVYKEIDNLYSLDQEVLNV